MGNQVLLSEERERERERKREDSVRGTSVASDHVGLCTELKAWEEVTCRDVTYGPEPGPGPWEPRGWPWASWGLRSRKKEMGEVESGPAVRRASKGVLVQIPMA